TGCKDEQQETEMQGCRCVFLALALGASVTRLPGQIGREVAMPVHLQDGETHFPVSPNSTINFFIFSERGSLGGNAFPHRYRGSMRRELLRVEIGIRAAAGIALRMLSASKALNGQVNTSSRRATVRNPNWQPYRPPINAAK